MGRVRKALLAKHGVGLPPHLEQQMANLPVPVPTGTGASGHDTPDANGFVALTGLTGYYAKLRYQVAEVSNALPAGSSQRGIAEANLTHANGEWIVASMITVGYAAVQVDDPTTGGKTWAIPKPATAIPGTNSLPAKKMVDGTDLSTVAGATAWFSKLAPPA